MLVVGEVLIEGHLDWKTRVDGANFSPSTGLLPPNSDNIDIRGENLKGNGDDSWSVSSRLVVWIRRVAVHKCSGTCVVEPGECLSSLR
jgi:hypothetical protein